MKTCTKCHQSLSESSFNRSKRNKNGLRAECRDCQRDSYKNYISKPEAKAKKKAWSESPIGKLISRLSDQKRNKSESRRVYKREKSRTPDVAARKYELIKISR